MQVYKSKNMCTGCSACANICPQHCITMQADEKGFLVPVVDTSKCVSCNACVGVCHTHSNGQSQSAETLFAFTHSKKDVLDVSSSGGAFYAIAEQVIQNGGYVCGAVWRADWSVCHCVTNRLDEVLKMCGSKYVQSDLCDCFTQIRTLLTAGQTVLFSGTPCQVIGLKSFLKKEYANLITVDFVCYGIPSPQIYKAYLQDIEAENGKIEHIAFRDKRNGWRQYGVAVQTQQEALFWPHQDNIYLKGFLGDLYNRSCCQDCPAKTRTGYFSDVTLGDLWGAEQLLSDVSSANGISAVIVHTEKGGALFDKADLQPCDMTVFKRTNPKYVQCSRASEYADLFWRVYRKKGLKKAYDAIYKPSFFGKLQAKFKR